MTMQVRGVLTVALVFVLAVSCDSSKGTTAKRTTAYSSAAKLTERSSLARSETDPNRTAVSALARSPNGIAAARKADGVSELLVVVGVIAASPVIPIGGYSKPAVDDPASIAAHASGDLYTLSVEQVLAGQLPLTQSTIPVLQSVSSGIQFHAGDRLLLIMNQLMEDPTKFAPLGGVNGVFQVDANDQVTPMVGTNGAQPNTAQRATPETLAQAVAAAKQIDPAITYTPPQ